MSSVLMPQDSRWLNRRRRSTPPSSHRGQHDSFCPIEKLCTPRAEFGDFAVTSVPNTSGPFPVERSISLFASSAAAKHRRWCAMPTTLCQQFRWNRTNPNLHMGGEGGPGGGGWEGVHVGGKGEGGWVGGGWGGGLGGGRGSGWGEGGCGGGGGRPARAERSPATLMPPVVRSHARMMFPLRSAGSSCERGREQVTATSVTRSRGLQSCFHSGRPTIREERSSPATPISTLAAPLPAARGPSATVHRPLCDVALVRCRRRHGRPLQVLPRYRPDGRPCIRASEASPLPATPVYAARVIPGSPPVRRTPRRPCSYLPLWSRASTTSDFLVKMRVDGALATPAAFACLHVWTSRAFAARTPRRPRRAVAPGCLFCSSRCSALFVIQFAQTHFVLISTGGSASVTLVSCVYRRRRDGDGEKAVPRRRILDWPHRHACAPQHARSVGNSVPVVSCSAARSPPLQASVSLSKQREPAWLDRDQPRIAGGTRGLRGGIIKASGSPRER